MSIANGNWRPVSILKYMPSAYAHALSEEACFTRFFAVAMAFLAMSVSRAWGRLQLSSVFTRDCCTKQLKPGLSLMTNLIARAMKDKSRPDRDVSRDARDNTSKVLSFIGIAPKQFVVDFLPFRGYYTRLFASIVGEQGHVFAAVPDALTRIERIEKGRAEIEAFAFDLPNLTLINGRPELAGSPPVPVDIFFISQNYHDLHDEFMGPVDIAKFNTSVFQCLKPGGKYIIIDHAAANSATPDVTETLHRIRPAVVREEVEAAGFVYRNKSTALSNDRDPKTGSIFGRTTRYHTDRFILKFEKPV